MNVSRAKAGGDHMSADAFRAELDRLTLNQVAAARLLGVNDRTVRRWILGERRVPIAVGKLVAAMSPDEIRQ